MPKPLQALLDLLTDAQLAAHLANPDLDDEERDAYLAEQDKRQRQQETKEERQQRQVKERDKALSTVKQVWMQVWLASDPTASATLDDAERAWEATWRGEAPKLEGLSLFDQASTLEELAATLVAQNPGWATARESNLLEYSLTQLERQGIITGAEHQRLLNAPTGLPARLQTIYDQVVAGVQSFLGREPKAFARGRPLMFPADLQATIGMIQTAQEEQVAQRPQEFLRQLATERGFLQPQNQANASEAQQLQSFEQNIAPGILDAVAAEEQLALARGQTFDRVAAFQRQLSQYDPQAPLQYLIAQRNQQQEARRTEITKQIETQRKAREGSIGSLLEQSGVGTAQSGGLGALPESLRAFLKSPPAGPGDDLDFRDFLLSQPVSRLQPFTSTLAQTDPQGGDMWLRLAAMTNANPQELAQFGRETAARYNAPQFRQDAFLQAMMTEFAPLRRPRRPQRTGFSIFSQPSGFLS